MFVKICGLRSAELARFAVERGADAIGVVMSPPSPRHADADTARRVLDAARGTRADIVTALVVREMEAAEAARTAEHLGFDVLQLHGAYTRDDFAAARAIHPRIWRATSLDRDPEVRVGDYGEELILLDGNNAGSGERWDLSRIDRSRLGERWLLAGGLDPDTVGEAIATAQPWGVDVSSGVESAPGVKDPALIERFIAAARG